MQLSKRPVNLHLLIPCFTAFLIGHASQTFGQPASATLKPTGPSPVQAANAGAREMVLAYLVLDIEPTAKATLVSSPIQKSAVLSTAARSRAAQIASQQAALTAQLAKSGIQVMGRYSRLANAVKVRVPAEALDQLKSFPGVARVETVQLYRLDTTESVPFIGASKVWGPLVKNADGAGVRIGFIDTGIDYTHADFGGSGDPADYSANDPTRVEPGTFPTAKVVGGFDFAGNSYNPASPDPAEFTPFPDPDPLDCSGHGTHVAGTASGFGVLTNGLAYHGPYASTLDFSDFWIGPGVAPKAKLYALKIFGCVGPTDLVLEALEWAADPNGDLDFSDRLDVVNLSLGSSFGIVSPNDVVLNAANHLAELGCVVVVAGGNSGNVFYTIGAPGVAERALSVGSSIDRRRTISALEVLSPRIIAGLYGAVEGVFTTPLANTGPIAGSVAYANPNKACDDLINAAELKGKIALIDRGTCFFTDKVKRAQDAGAIAVIMVNNVNGPPVIMSGTRDGVTIPGVMISRADGDILKASIPLELRVRLDSELVLPGTDLTDQLSDFSSRGPSSPGSLLKPELTAPGEGIFSAAVGTGTNGMILSGTSLSAPHVSGAAALLKQLHPAWPVEEIKAALMNTAAPTHDENGVAYPESRAGAGRVQVDRAAEIGVTAAAEDAKGSVSLSLGALTLTDAFSQVRRVRLTNHGTNAVTFNVSIEPAVSEPGFELKPFSSVVSVPPFASVSLPFECNADPKRFERTGDSTTPARSNGLARHTLYEASGKIYFRNDDTSIQVPYYAVLRAGSDYSVTAAQLGVPLGSNTVTVTIPVRGASAHPTPLVSVFQLGASSRNQKLGDPVFAAADLLAVGAATDAATQGSVENCTLYFGIATAESWTTPQSFLIGLEVLIDMDHDGIIDFVLVNGSDGALAAGDLSNPDVANDVFLTVVRDVLTGEVTSGGFLNVYSANQRDTAPFNNSVLVLSVPAGLLGLTDASSRFNYRVVSRGPDGFRLIDQTDWIVFDAGKPAVDTSVFGAEGYPTRTDGAPIKVQVNRSAAAAGGFSATNPLSVLVLHHFNPFPRRLEIVRLDLESDDTDRDGLQDSWEIDQFTDLLTAGSGSDHDRDGFADVMEFRAGTNPKDPGSRFTILSVAGSAGGGVQVRWASAPGRFYTLERSTILDSRSFAPIASHLPATPPVNTGMDTNAPRPGPYYYRIKLD